MDLLPGHKNPVFLRGNLFQVIAIHLVTLFVAPFFFTWDAFLFSATIMFPFAYAMGMFHHMYLTHRSFGCKKWVENLGSLMGTLTWRGPFAGPVQYVAVHRIHHAYSDRENDPHTPVNGIFHALLGWFWRMPQGCAQRHFYNEYAKDVAADSWHLFLDRNVHLVQAFWGILCFTLGSFVPLLWGETVPNPRHGLSYLLYGVFVRAFLTLYLVNAVDVINHTIGYRGYETGDHSTNSFLMAGIHLGGAISWHNNHHAHQDYFSVKRYWWEFDVHHLFLSLLSIFGLVWDIKTLDESKKPVPAA